MRFLKRNSNVILVSLLEAVIGILLLVDPVRFTTAIIFVFGIVLLVGGVLSVIRYFRADPVSASVSGDMVKGLVMLLAGAFLAIRPSWLITTFPVLMILYGIVILVGGLYKAQWFIDALRLKAGKWLFHLINAAVSIVCGFVILANPFASTVVMWMFIGISLVVEAALDVVALIIKGRGAANPDAE